MNGSHGEAWPSTERPNATRRSRKSEARIPKSETNPKCETRRLKNRQPRCFCFEFRASNFEFVVLRSLRSIWTIAGQNVRKGFAKVRGANSFANLRENLSEPRR